MEIRQALAADPDGPPLLLLAPKQTTYQLERQLLADGSVSGYTRLHILSFERLALFLFDQLQQPRPRLLNEEGRLMVLRGLLAEKRDQLKLFRASSRLTGFCRHLSVALRELQHHQLTPESLRQLAEKSRAVEGLGAKLHDFADLLADYLDWLRKRDLRDAGQLPDLALALLRAPHPSLDLGKIWVDGFTEFSPQELDLLVELIPIADGATITFCLDRVPDEKISWLSNWAMVRRTYAQCHERLARLPDYGVTAELLPRDPDKSRFTGNPVLRHLEMFWAAEEPKPFSDSNSVSLKPSLRIAACASPEAEAVLAAREILRFLRRGGRCREVTVLARNLEEYHAPLINILARYDIPCFLDRRELVSHHPLAELTRNALRTIAFSWLAEDWFAALKTGLVPASESDIDRLENEALARGWRGGAWQKPIAIADDPDLSRWAEDLRQKIVPPFSRLELALARHKNKPNGAELAAALRDFWRSLKIEDTLRVWSTDESAPRPVHATVWEQMNAWLDNVELAFPAASLSLRDWLPVLDAGLSGLTVGVIPPALDQVFIGAIDRSRNPDIRLAIVLGMNESVFPAPPDNSVLLTEADRDELRKQGVRISNLRRQLSQERFYGYVACTRARQRLVLTYCAADSSGKPLNPSPFVFHVQQLFPALEIESFPRSLDWRGSEHTSELIPPLLLNQSEGPGRKIPELSRLNDLPALTRLRNRLQHLVAAPSAESFSPALASRLYGPALRTSVSRMEQFAACPFRFFVHSGLRAEERKKFELDIRDQGNFQHEVLAGFHNQLKKDGKRWRDITPREARERIGKVAAALMIGFRDGLLHSTEETRFTARIMSESLQDFVETLIGWMRSQYSFDPAAVELPFGDENNTFPPWELDLGENRRLLLRGRIDRVDLCPDASGDEALCVVVDYKSSQKQLDPLLMAHGLQLQLAAYLNVLRRWPNPQPIFGVSRLVPAGVFYVNLRGKYDRGQNRDEALSNAPAARCRAYRHLGRFDAQTLPKLDQRPDVKEGDQFNYRLTADGGIHSNSRDALGTADFLAMLAGVESALQAMGRSIYAGEAKVDPYRNGSTTACEQCQYHAICRIDPWTHHYRVLAKNDEQT